MTYIGHNWFHPRKTQQVRGKARTQNLWTLHLAGDFHTFYETERQAANPHLMRCMLTTNLDVEGLATPLNVSKRLICYARADYASHAPTI